MRCLFKAQPALLKYNSIKAAFPYKVIITCKKSQTRIFFQSFDT